MEEEGLKNTCVSVKLCHECGCRMKGNQTYEYLTVFHPQIKTLVQKISKKVMNFPEKIDDKFPSMDCHNLCAAKKISNRLIANLTKEGDPNSLVLIQQLSDTLIKKVIEVSDCTLTFGNQKICTLCGLKFRSTRLAIHLTLRHPECLALVQFLRCHSLSELNFQKDVVALSITKTQELIKHITSPTVLATRQLYVKLEKLPSHLLQECITKGYVNVKKNTDTSSPFHIQSNCNRNEISAELIKNIKHVVENSPFPDKNNLAVVIVPKKSLKTSLENSKSERHISSRCKKVKNATVSSPSKIIRYGVEDLKRDELRRQQEKEKIATKEEMLRKILAKHQEKEIKKKVLYWQKKLTRYVMQHQKLLFKLEHNLTNARQSGTSRLPRDKLFKKVDYYVKSNKVKKSVIYLLKKLFETMDKIPAVNETKKELSNMDLSSDSPKKGDKSPQGEIQNCFPPNNGKGEESDIPNFHCKENPTARISPSVCKLGLDDAADPYMNSTLITDDKQLVECFCGKLNCLGLHSENFYYNV